MKNELLHTPDGVRDIYNRECKVKLRLQEQLHGVLNTYGYQDIQTPAFEFFNIFSREIGTIPSKDLYKFFDKEGNTLVLRPDFTPAVARSAVKYYTDEDFPVKLCYMGNTYINSSDYQGRLKENTQCGAELIGDSTVAADAEILSMVVDALKACGLREFQISVGHALFFSGLVQASRIDEDIEEELRTLISNKNFFGVEEIVDALEIAPALKELFKLMGNFNLTEADLVTAKELAKPYEAILKAFEDLELLYEYLKMYGIDNYVAYEMGLISDYHYYTGIVFAGYTFGTGEPIVKGGRYDKLLSHFGKDIPAIGFAIVVDQLMAALSRQNISTPVPEQGALLVFTEQHAAKAIQKAKLMRSQGMSVDMQLMRSDKDRDHYLTAAVKKHITKVEFIDE